VVSLRFGISIGDEWRGRARITGLCLLSRSCAGCWREGELVSGLFRLWISVGDDGEEELEFRDCV